MRALGKSTLCEPYSTGSVSSAGLNVAILARILLTTSHHGGTENCQGVAFGPIHPYGVCGSRYLCSVLTFYLFGNEAGAVNSKY
jgi:hypothetical protein